MACGEGTAGPDNPGGGSSIGSGYGVMSMRPQSHPQGFSRAMVI